MFEYASNIMPEEEQEETFDIFKYLFSYNTIHYTYVDYDSYNIEIMYIPLSLKERVEINNKYTYIDNKQIRQYKTILDSCKKMINKAYDYDKYSELKEMLSDIFISKVYESIMYDIKKDIDAITEFYDKNKTKKLTSKDDKEYEKTYSKSKLNDLLSISSFCKEYTNLDEISRFDTVSLKAYQYAISELTTREHNKFVKSQDEIDKSRKKNNR